MITRPNYSITLENIASSIPSVAFWLLSNRCKELDDFADQFVPYIIAELPIQDRWPARTYGLLLPLYRHLKDAPTRSNREQHVQNLLEAVASGCNDTVYLEELHDKAFKRQWYGNIVELWSLPSKLRATLHSLLKIDSEDDARRHLTLSKLSGIFVHIVSWVDNCDEIPRVIKERFRTVVAPTTNNGLLVLADSCEALFRGLGKQFKDLILYHYACLPKGRWIASCVSLDQLEERFRRYDSLLSNDDVQFLQSTSHVEPRHLAKFYWYYMHCIKPKIWASDSRIRASDNTGTQTQRYGYFRTVIRTIRKHLCYEDSDIFQDDNGKEFINLFVPLLFCLIYNARDRLPEAYNLIVPHISWTELRENYTLYLYDRLDDAMIRHNYATYNN